MKRPSRAVSQPPISLQTLVTTLHGMTSVAVAVNGGPGVGGKGSLRAVKWAVENLLPKADRFILVHVMPTITSIPTPSGDLIAVEELDENVVGLYVEEMKVKCQEDVFVPYLKLCKSHNKSLIKVETMVLEDDNPATALMRYVSRERIHDLVLGSCSVNGLVRKVKGLGVPATVLKYTPLVCDVTVVAKDKVVTKSADLPSTNVIEASSTNLVPAQLAHHNRVSSVLDIHDSGVFSPSEKSKAQRSFDTSSLLELGLLDSQAFEHVDPSFNGSLDMDSAYLEHQENHLYLPSNSSASQRIDQSNVQAQMEQLHLELQNALTMYKRACEELVYTQHKVQMLSSEFLEESKRVNAAVEREESLRKLAAEEKAKYLQAKKEIEDAKNKLAKEAHERQIAELNALKESSEKKKIVDALFTRDKRYRRYTRDEIEVATDCFSERNVIGEGGYGKVYKCNLDHTPVAVKVLRTDAVHKKEEFLREIEVLSQLRHPHMVLLVGACPDTGCLVYEYLENGSLDECLFHCNGRPPLPWFVRFRIIFQVACGLSFLHNSKPEPIVHRDLKPGNILLDKNYVSKIGDVGLAKLISDVVPDNITEYRDSMLAGTLQYMDPEYQRTGTIRPKSDLYAFGIIILQVLTARRPNGLLLTVENAIDNASFAEILDTSVTDWPLVESKELAQLALECSKLRCRERPDLDTEVLPVLRRLVDIAAARVKVEKNIYAPNHYFCPILQDVMEEPYIAADGFTYERRAIQAWLDKHNVSPVTMLKLQRTTLTPDHTLRSAIQEWKSRVP